MSTNRNFYRRQDEEEERNNPYRLDPKKSDSRGRLPRYKFPSYSTRSKGMIFFGCLVHLLIISCSYLFFNFLLHLIID